MELVVAKVEGGVDWLEGLEIDVDLSFLALGSENFPTVDDQSIGGDLVVQFESLLGRGNGREDGLTIDSGLDIRGRTLHEVCQRGKREKKGMQHARILQPTSLPRGKLDPWGLRGGQSTV